MKVFSQNLYDLTKALTDAAKFKSGLRVSKSSNLPGVQITIVPPCFLKLLTSSSTLLPPMNKICLIFWNFKIFYLILRTNTD